MNACLDCNKPIKSWKAVRCRDCYFKHSRKEYVICPRCKQERYRTEFRKLSGKNRKDSRDVGSGCNACRKPPTKAKIRFRTCVACNTSKPVGEFLLRHRTCIQCEQTLEAQRHAVARKRIESDALFRQGYKLCVKCNAIKLLDAFGKHSENRDGRQRWCQQLSSGGIY